MGRNTMELDSKDAPPGYASHFGSSSGDATHATARLFKMGPGLKLGNVFATSKLSHPHDQRRLSPKTGKPDAISSLIHKIGRLAGPSTSSEPGGSVKDASKESYTIQFRIRSFQLAANKLSERVSMMNTRASTERAGSQEPVFKPVKMSLLLVPVFANQEENVHAGRFRGAAQVNAQHSYRLHGSEFRLDADRSVSQEDSKTHVFDLKEHLRWDYEAAATRSSDLIGFRLVAEGYMHPDGFFDEGSAKILRFEVFVSGKSFLQTEKTWSFHTLLSRSDHGELTLDFENGGSLFALLHVDNQLMCGLDVGGAVLAAPEDAILNNSPRPV